MSPMFTVDLDIWGAHLYGPDIDPAVIVAEWGDVPGDDDSLWDLSSQ